MNTIICSSCASFGFNDLFVYARNIKLLKKKLANSKLQENVMKRIKPPRGSVWKFATTRNRSEDIYFNSFEAFTQV